MFIFDPIKKTNLGLKYVPETFPMETLDQDSTSFLKSHPQGSGIHPPSTQNTEFLVFYELSLPLPSHLV
jgi:hypothetical protein